MTVIAACKKDGKVCIGSDSLVVTDGEKALHMRKITKFNHFMVGIAGEYKFHQILEEMNKDIEAIKSIPEARKFAKLVYSAYKEDCEHDDDVVKEVVFLIATPEAIYEVDSYFCCLERQDIAAIGTGANYAKAAMQIVLKQEIETDPFDIVRMGIDSAAHFCVDCGLPSYVFEVKKESPPRRKK